MSRLLHHNAIRAMMYFIKYHLPGKCKQNVINMFDSLGIVLTSFKQLAQHSDNTNVYGTGLP